MRNNTLSYCTLRYNTNAQKKKKKNMFSHSSYGLYMKTQIHTSAQENYNNTADAIQTNLSDLSSDLTGTAWSLFCSNDLHNLCHTTYNDSGSTCF